MKNYLIIFFSCILITSCLFGDNTSSSKRLTKDFWLNWFEYPSDRHILYSFSDKGDIGTYVVERTVFAVGFNDDFIIAKQHPEAGTDKYGKPIPNFDITNYYIVDIRNYESGNSNSFKVHRLNKNGYQIMREYLDVPDDLTFSIIDTDLN